MTDRELIEAAAKAAGIVGEYVENLRVTTDCGRERFTGIMTGPEQCWNPIADDGDALRLAVALAIKVEPSENGCSAFWRVPLGLACTTVLNSVIGDDSNAATRRAVVQAAAAVAKLKTPNVRGNAAPTARGER